MKISKQKLFYALLLLVQLRPESIDYLSPALDKIWNGLSAVSFVILLTEFIKRSKKFSANKYAVTMLIAVICYSVTLIISTILSNGMIINSFFETAYLLSMFITIQLMIIEDPKNMIHSGLILYGILLIINFVSVIIYYPGGIYHSYGGYSANYFLGAKNVYILYSLPFLTFFSLKRKKGGLKISLFDVFCYFAAICSFASVIIVWSAGSMTLMVLFVLFAMLPIKLKHSSFFNARNYVIIVAILFFSLVIFKNIDYLKWIVVDILHKNFTFTGRTEIWNAMLRAISKRIWIGYGIQNADYITNITGEIFGINAHNTYLWTLFRGGVFHSIALAVLVGSAIKKLLMYKQYHASKVISWSIFLVMILWIIEATSLRALMPLFIVAVNCDSFLAFENQNIYSENKK